jgi:hypothetical protein
MAGYRAAGVVLLAAAALLALAAADDEHLHHWRCFRSCARDCHGEDALDDGAAGGGLNNVSAGGGVSHKCKTGCLHECFEDLPALCYQQCVVSTCLCLPPCRCTARPRPRSPNGLITSKAASDLADVI